MAAPTVEMLWAADDPAVVLRERFGHADAHSVIRWLTGVLTREYGIALISCTRVVMSDQNAIAWVTTPVGPLVVKWCVDAT